MAARSDFAFMKVFRLENVETREGAYCSGAMRKFWPSEDRNAQKHPTPYDDSLLENTVILAGKAFYPNDYHFGFQSIEQFRRWFYNDEVLLRFKNDSFVLSVYNVPVAYYGHTQAIYPSEYHEEEFIVERIELDTLINPDKRQEIKQ